MIRHLCKRQGFTMIMALAIMGFLGIFIAGLLPFLSNVVKISGASQEQLQAGFAAEAGAKRAIVSVARYAYDNTSTTADWAWLGASTSVLNDASAGSYVVTLQKLNGTVWQNYAPTAGAMIPAGKYTVTSIGTFKSYSATIYVEVPVGTDFQVDFKSLQWRNKKL
jgi:hypothetical protein